MLAHGLHLGHRVDHVVGEIVGMWRRESQAPDTLHRPNRPQQVAEAVFAVEVGVHRLAQQRYLAHAFGHHLLGFAHDIGQLPAAFGAARGRHDAVRTAVVAATLHRDPRLDLVEATRGEVFVVLLHVEGGVHGALAVARFGHELGECAIPVGAHDEAHMLRPVQQLRPQSLRHTAGDTDHTSLLHRSLEFTQPPDHPLLRVITNGAGVEQDHIRIVRRIDRAVAFCRQFAEHELGVAHVHLTTVGLDVDRRVLEGSHDPTTGTRGTAVSRSALPSSRMRRRAPRGGAGSAIETVR